MGGDKDLKASICDVREIGLNCRISATVAIVPKKDGTSKYWASPSAHRS